MTDVTKDQSAREPNGDEPSEQAEPHEPAEPSADGEPRAAAADESKTSVQRSAAHEEEDVALDAKGRERPRFLLKFPQDPSLQRLAAAFEAGNYALVREEGPALVERTEDPAVRDAANELLRRIEPDPLAKYLLALTAALLLSLAYFAYNH